MRLRKFVEADLTMTMKIKVIDTDANIPKIYFGYSVDPSTAWYDPKLLSRTPN